MTTLRLLPILLFATSSLLVLKVTGLATGTGSFALGPAPAIAAGGGEHGGSEGGGTPADSTLDATIDNSMLMGEPLDLAKEAAELAKKKGSSGHGGGEAASGEGHGEAAPAGGHGEAAPAAEGHGEAAPAAEGHGEAAAAGGHGEAAPAAAGGHGETAPAAEGHGEAAPAAEGHGEAAPAAEGHGEAAAAGGHGEAAPAAGGHGEAAAAGGHGEAAGGHGAEGGSTLPAGVSTTRPEEYQPPASESEARLLEALANRRKTLDQRESEIDMRMKLLQAAEEKLQKRVDELKSIQEQLGQVPGAGGDGAAAGAGGAGGAGEAGGGGGGGAAASAEDPASEQLKALVAMYEAMKPKAAAEVFNTLDLTVLVAIARHMNPRKLSPILAAMQPAHAAKVTIALAGDQGPRQIVVRTEEDTSGPPSLKYVEPAPEPMTLEPLPGTEDPAALPKIGPAPSG